MRPSTTGSDGTRAILLLVVTLVWACVRVQGYHDDDDSPQSTCFLIADTGDMPVKQVYLFSFFLFVYYYY